MSIVFGWYSFKIKSYKPEYFSIKNEQQEDITFEVRQKCFHLFWIPFFSIGKMYALRKEGQLYSLPEEYVTLVKGKGKHKTPWYSFLLPILVVIGLVGYGLNEKYESYKSNQYWKTEYEYSLSQIDNELSHLTTDHYIKIRDLGNWYQTEGLYLKVEMINNSNIKLLLIETKLHDYEALPFLVKEFYLITREGLETIHLTIDEIEQAICRDFKIFNDRKEFGYPLLKDGKNYIIETIEYINGPVIKDRGTGSYVRMQLQNFGSPVKLVEIRNIENNITWNNTLPMHIPTDSTTYKYFSLDGENYTKDTEYKFMLVFKDSLNNEYKYIMYGKNMDRRLERVLG